MSFKPRKNKLSVRVRGILSSPISYEVRVSDGNWKPWISTYEPQKWGVWDSESCWMIDALNWSVSMQLKWFETNNIFSPEALEFFKQYKDANGNYALSEQFLEILSGNVTNGGTAEEAAQLIKKYGIIPRSMLCYNTNRASRVFTESQFESDYFNTGQITPAMRALGQESLKYINVSSKRIGRTWSTPPLNNIQAALKQAPLSIGIPVPINVFKWNNQFIQYDGGTHMQHEVCIYNMEENNSYDILDQYNPFEKVLSNDYYIPSVVQIIVSVVNPIAGNPIPQNQNVNSLWTLIERVWNGLSDLWGNNLS